MIEENRPLLIFKHNPKAAGGTLAQMFKDMFKNKLENKKFMSEIIGNKKKERKIDPKQTFVLINEGGKVGSDYREHGFVISSIREPCSHSISLWCFGSAGKGGFAGTMWKEHPEWAKKAYGQDGPLYNSERDIEKYQNVFLKKEGIAETDLYRFSNFFLKPSSHDKDIGHDEFHRPNVDCWIYVENFLEDTVSCLKQYERQGGYVNWKASKVKELVDALEKKQHRRLYTKGGIESPQASHHATCQSYYTDDAAALIENKNSLIYTMFGYEGCCSKNYVVQPDHLANFINVERERNIAEKNNDITSAPSSGRSLLIFKNSRGISSPILEEVLKEIKPIKMSRDEFSNITYLSRKGRKSIKRVKDTFVNFAANENIIPVDQNHGFVMSIIREPCSHYVSEFRSGSEGKGEVHDYWEKYSPEWTKAAYGQDGPGFDSSQDIDRFRDVWYSKNEGMIGSYFKQHYLQSGDEVKAPVDCWVRVEAFESTLLSCLQQFEQQGGHVEWATPALVKMVDTVKKNQQIEAEEDDISDDISNDIGGGDENSLLCSKYFNDETASMVGDGKESFLYDMFGYDKCCGVVSRTDLPLYLDSIVAKQGGLSLHINEMKEEWRDAGPLAPVFFICLVVCNLFFLVHCKKRIKKNEMDYGSLPSKDEEESLMDDIVDN